MAKFSASIAFDFRNILEMAEGSTSTSVISSTHVNQTDSYVGYDYHGTGLGWDGTNLSGTLTALHTTYAGFDYFSLTGTVFNLANDVGETGYRPIDYPQLFGWMARVAYMLRGSDEVTGSMDGDRLGGYNGNDTMSGGGGNDSLEGGVGADSMLGGDGLDTLTGGTGDDTMRGDAGDDFFNGGAGNDSMNGGAGFDAVDYSGSVAVTVNLGRATNQHVSTTFGTDQLTSVEYVRGSSAGDILVGNASDNMFHGQGGNDTINGADGFDWADYFRATAAVTVNLSLATNQAQGADGTDRLIGIEAVRGSNFHDVLTGNDDDNWLRGLRGNDNLNGGEGSDWADYRDALGGVSVNLGLATNQATGADGTDQLVSIEHLRGGRLADMLVGNDGDNFLRGLQGNDTLDGAAGGDWADYREAAGAVSVNLATGRASGADGTDTLSNIERVRGSLHNDVITGSVVDNVLRGLAGNDRLDGGGGFDVADYSEAASGVKVNLALASNQATGGDGTDQLLDIEGVLGSRNNDTLTGDAGDNTLRGRGGDDVLDGGAGTDLASYRDAQAAIAVDLRLTTSQATGGDGTDRLVGMEGLEGGSFNDTLTGGAAAELFRGRGGNDSIDGGGGVDLADYRDAGRAVSVDLGRASNHATGDGTDQLIAIENLRGSNGFGDTLRGAAGRNVIEGLGGNDVIGGGAGADSLVGGAGNDIFDFDALTESGITATTRDTIADFIRSQDRIDLRTIDANTANGAGTNEAFNKMIAGSSEFTAAGQLKLSGGVLFGNTDADATAEFSIALTGITAVNSADFLL
ncbi:MAG TPA: hypothetical protein VIL30_00840 [Ramlibacter sp.]